MLGSVLVSPGPLVRSIFSKRKSYIQKGVEENKKKLKTPCIDILDNHQPDPVKLSQYYFHDGKVETL